MEEIRNLNSANENGRGRLVSALTRAETLLSDLSHVLGAERIGPHISSRILWRSPNGAPEIALTFDDGPQPVYTPKLLKILAKWEVPATFFLIGRHLEKNMSLGEEVVAAGHEVANHTFTHPILINLDDSEIAVEINRTDLLLRKLVHRKPRFLRPPMGIFTPRVLDMIEQAGYRTVIGDVYPRDPHMPGGPKILNRVLKRTSGGSIIILHDGGNGASVDRSQTIWAIDRIIPALLERGFRFVTLSEMVPE